MDVEKIALGALGEWGVYFAIGIFILPIVCGAFSFLYGALKIYSELFVMKRLKRLIFIRQGSPDGASLSECLDRNIELERFRCAFNMKVNYRGMAKIIEIERLGFWSPEQIGALKKYLRCSDIKKEPEIVIGRGDKVEAYFCFILCWALFAVGVFMWILFVWKLFFYGFLLGMILFFVALVVAASLASEFAGFKSSLEIRDYLSKELGYLDK